MSYLHKFMNIIFMIVIGLETPIYIPLWCSYWKVANRSTNREIRYLLWRPEVYYHVQESQALVPILSEIIYWI
jgi:hypothetical protein